MWYIMCALLACCMGHSSIGGLYGGIALLVGCMGHSSIGGVYNVCSI